MGKFVRSVFAGAAILGGAVGCEGSDHTPQVAESRPPECEYSFPKDFEASELPKDLVSGEFIPELALQEAIRAGETVPYDAAGKVLWRASNGLLFKTPNPLVLEIEGQRHFYNTFVIGTGRFDIVVSPIEQAAIEAYEPGKGRDFSCGQLENFVDIVADVQNPADDGLPRGVGNPVPVTEIGTACSPDVPESCE